jgi:hypothetical protein
MCFFEEETSCRSLKKSKSGLLFSVASFQHFFSILRFLYSMFPIQVMYIDVHMYGCGFSANQRDIFANVGWCVYFSLDGFLVV